MSTGTLSPAPARDAPPELLASIARLIADRKPDVALADARSALSSWPESAGLWCLAGAAHQRLGDPDAAALAHGRALQLSPGLPQATSGLASAQGALGHHAQAADLHRAVLATQPGHPGLQTNLAMSLHLSGQHDEARALVEDVLAHRPGFAPARYVRSHMRLLAGDLSGGFADFEARFTATGLWSPQSLVFRSGRWNGEPLEGRTIAVHSEQGLGDSLQFLRYLPLLAERQPARLLLLIQRELRSLVVPFESIATIHASGQAIPEFDVHVPMMSLPHALGIKAAGSPSAYLGAHPQRVAYWEARYPAGEGPRIGLVWAGAGGHIRDRERSLPAERLRALARLPARWVSLQRGPRAADLQAVPGLKALPWGEQVDDFADTAAIIATLDLVITVDTSVAHLAGAMGKPVWVLLTAVPDWRWQLQRRDSDWYASARLYRQPAAGDWVSVMAEVAADLRERFPTLGAA